MCKLLTALFVLAFIGFAEAREIVSYGGEMTSFIAQTRHYQATGEELRLRVCNSACTMFLSANACVYPNTRMMFHKAFKSNDPNGSERLYDSTGEYYDSVLMSHYPYGVQQLLGGYLTAEGVVLNGRQLITAGVRQCVR